MQRKPQLTVAALSPQSQEAAPNPDGAKLQLQCKRQTDASEATPEFETALNSASGGQPLASQFRLQAENLMGADFSGVKIHTDGAADQLNQSIQAKAFTTRQDIFFRQGEYNPSSSEGQKLLAHELTHVVQQNSGTVRRKEKGAAIGLSSTSQSMIQADKEHLQVPPPQNEPAEKDAMPPRPQANAELPANRSRANDDVPDNRLRSGGVDLSSNASNASLSNESSSDSQSESQLDKNHLQVPSPQNEPAEKDAMPPRPRANAALPANRSRANDDVPSNRVRSNAKGKGPSQDNDLQNAEEQDSAADASNQSLSIKIDSVDDDAVDAQSELETEDVVTSKTIKKSLTLAGQSYAETELSALGVEKLYYTFEEDKSYVEEAYANVIPEEIEIAAKENEEQLQHLDEQLKNQADQPQDDEQAKEQPKAESEKEKTKREKEEKHKREHLKVYFEQMKNKEQADSELDKARKHTETAQQSMTRNYERRSEVGKLYQHIQELREEFAAPSKNADVKYKSRKQEARKTSEENASKASKIRSEAKKDEAELKGRKKELQNAKRAAVDLDDFIKWVRTKLGSKAIALGADVGYGLISGGYLQVKAEEDKRGFQKPIESTTVRQEARKAYEQINRERKAIETIQSKAGLEVFDKADKAVYILQLLDKGILTGFKRILRYMKIYASILSSLPAIGFVFGAIATGLTLVSGAVSGVQAIMNTIIATIRGLQVWKGDGRLQGLFKMAAIDAGVNGFAGSLKTVVFGLDQAGDMQGLDQKNPNFNFGNVNIGNVDLGNQPIDDVVEKPINSVDNAIEKSSNSVDDGLNKFLSGSTGVEATATLSKPLGEEVAKVLSKEYKLFSKVKKGELGRNADGTVRLLFTKAANSVLRKTDIFKMDVEPFSANVEENRVALDEANKEATENAKKCEDKQQVEQAQEPLAALNESSGVMQDADAALKDVLAAVSN
ncbi:MAG: DUF4157 domain-containing protein (plasmid) [Leptolyngbya sp. BL-A-14]